MHQCSDYSIRSPSSSPSLNPVDSSPPSSPSLTAICTPPASPGAKDPFAGSTKSSKRPRIYERSGSSKSIGTFDACHAGDAAVHLLTRPGVPLGEDEITDATPTRLARVIDPFSGSAKHEWRPPTHEKKTKRVTPHNNAVGSPPSSFSYAYENKPMSKWVSPTPINRNIDMDLDDPDDFHLTDDEIDYPKLLVKPRSKEELEHKLWDEAITGAIDKLNGIIDLSGTGLNKGAITHIPPSIADLEGFVVLPTPSSAPPSPTLSPTLLPSNGLTPLSAFSTPRPFTRATTLPAAVFNESFFRSKDGERLRGTPAARATTLQTLARQPTSQLRRREIHMFLANNSITKLPAELFRVTALTVLSLRSNALTSVPPQISQLTVLQELNLAQNKLCWLPAEMLSMRLTKLTISGNPWIPPPSSRSRDDPKLSSGLSSEHAKRPVSDTIIHFSIPPLTEMCMRVLITPCNPVPSHSPPHPPSSSPSRHPESSTRADSGTNPGPHTRSLTVLEASYALPLTEDLYISPAVLSTLRACVPVAVARPAVDQLPAKVRRDDEQRDVHTSTPDTRARTQDAVGVSPADDEDVFAPPSRVADPEDVAGISTCPSPVHRADDDGSGSGTGSGASAWRGGLPPVLVRPAEERWTWEETIAGVRVGTEGGMGVPVRWRGCSWGCLAFLDPPQPPPPSRADPDPVDAGGEDALGLDVDVEADVDEDVEMEDVVEELRFEGGLADPEDFEEAF